MDRHTETFTQMGGEGVTWVGQAPFTKTPHVFANLGDGTYFHSGILAIRAAVAAGVNITYKILYNDAVAMTGGQPVDGEISVPQITHQLFGEGVRRIVVVSDEPDKYPTSGGFAHGVEVRHRDDLDRIQRELREIPGVTAIVYDQTCAAEKRRRRKRGLMPDPPKRVLINEAVCEGCGDCSVQSNCLSVVPVETEFGRKRAIDQSSCNKDYSCLKGFCPSFVTVHGGKLRKNRAGVASPAGGDRGFDTLPEPTLPDLDEPWGVLVTGVGGTGVVTIGALIGMAAHLEGKGCSVLDMTGLAQKGGAVYSHIRIARRPDDIHAVRIAAGGARLLLGCDIVVAGSYDSLAKVEVGHTRAVVNTHETITGDFTRNPDFTLPTDRLRRVITDAAGPEATDLIDATRLATALMGDSIATNLFMLGYAYQKGLVPVSGEALLKAIELNAAAVDANKRAFLWGRRAAVDFAAVERAAAPALEEPPSHRIARTLDEIVATRADHLTRYQNAAYAGRYRAVVERTAAAEGERAKGLSGLAEAVARSYHKLLAYKDEYEVARLYTDGTFLKQLQHQFEGDVRLKFHLAPPILGERDPETGHLKKREFGPWMLKAFALLAGMKRLRGTPFDIFGRTAERRRERAMIGTYESVVAELLAGLDHESHALAVEIAALPQSIRGYGHIKEASINAAEAKLAELLSHFRARPPRASAAE
jgi:indolepyruvate ferredoxin oxidoreductase